MRRYSVTLAAALLLISAVVGYTLKLRWDKMRAARVFAPPAIRTVDEGLAPSGWRYQKDDPQSNRPVVRVDARAFEGTHDPSTFELKGMRLRLYDKKGTAYTYVKTEQALFDEGSGVLKSEAPVYIVRDVPADKDAEDPKEAAKRVRVTTSGVTYETKTGKASSNDPASFVFTEGDGKAVGLEYDPNTKLLHLKSQVALDWIGKGPVEKKMHIETDDLVYNEAEGKIHLSPWARMTRQGTRIEARNTLVKLENGRLHQIEGDQGVGSDTREDRKTSYSADKMTAIFDDEGNLVQIIGDQNAKVESSQPGAHTLLTGARADLRFALETKQQNGTAVTDSQLHLVMADGHSVAESVPLPQPGVQIAETRILRSEHIELEMKPGGKDLKEIRTSSAAQLEFKPNRPDQAHRILDASHLRVLYGAGSYVDTLLAWNVATHTDKSAALAKPKKGPDGKLLPLAPALTWSDQMTAKFAANSNQVASIDQPGNFRYEEGTRKAWAKRAFLEQTINRITLTDQARVLDDTGSAVADKIVMNQASGDMDASGHVLSTHEPDRNEKPGTSMLDATKSMQAQADQMQTRENNTKVFYEGHVVMWQGANRISADEIAIDRDTQSLDANGNVISELVDNKASGDQSPKPDAAAVANSGPIYTVVRAPKLVYRDDVRIANYTEGVKLVRDKMTITSKELQAYLTPKSDKTTNDSSLDHAVATGNVEIFDVVAPGRTRTGTGQRCEYYTKQDKVVLNGGAPQMVDSYKGVVKGGQLTYFSGEDHLIVDGRKEQVAFTRMKKK
ncbi:MAG: LPS export ABC transporter periplasmic protein LptC [Acidobacteriaceae bacterium]|nr:LPS export ABC transporter periplasmic protein LptC [Acidobacteriaceae bacterium]